MSTTSLVALSGRGLQPVCSTGTRATVEFATRATSANGTALITVNF